MCREAVHHKDRKVLFSVIGLRNRIAEWLSDLLGLTAKEDDLSEFGCRRCVDSST